ncbi:hypothetical protein ACFPH6_32675 [Streptomyces xiangluensis]|uniref:Uncharacterized protein n=1 Tax=Streptomyces xiangluensis TaxID=2665720 RepID=A0ABV8YZ60_9ACTN
MELQMITAWLRVRVKVMREARDRGATSTELAVIAGSLLVGAGLLVVAIRTKLAEKIGIIEGG